MAATPQGVKVEIAFTTTPDDPSPAWTDITAYVRDSGITITRGRQNEFGQVQPGTCVLAVDNTTGRFTPGLATGAYYPNVLLRKKIRVTTVSPAAVSSRFTGYVDSWPTQWPSGGAWYSEAQIVAVDRFKRLSRGATLSNIISEEYLQEGPYTYFTLGEPAESTTVGDTSAAGTAIVTAGAVGSVVQKGTGGTLEFAKSTGPGSDGLSAPLFTRVDASNGQYLQAVFPDGGFSDFAGTLECFFNTTDAEAKWLATVEDSAGNNVLGLYITGGQLVGVQHFGNATSPGTVNDGATHHAAVVFDGASTLTLYLDGVSVASNAGLSPWFGATRLSMGGSASAGAVVYTGTLAHVAYFRYALLAARLLQHANAGLTGFAGERSDQRVARFARLAGIPTAEQNLETGLSTSISTYDTTGKNPLQAMQDITATESGVLQMQGDGKLNFQSRSHRYNVASAVTISNVNLDVRFDDDDQLLINDVTASRPAGITYRSADQASITEYGYARESLTLYVTSDNEVIAAADWAAHRYSTPQSRIGNLTVDILAVPSIATAILGLDVGSKITASGLPAQAPAASLDLFVEGWTETIRTFDWTFKLNTSAADQFFAWQLDSATYSVLGVSTKPAY